MNTSQVRIVLALLVVGASLVMGLLVISGFVTHDPALAGTVGIVIGNAFAEVKIVLARFFPSGDSESTSKPENR